MHRHRNVIIIGITIIKSTRHIYENRCTNHSVYHSQGLFGRVYNSRTPCFTVLVLNPNSVNNLRTGFCVALQTAKK